jgi:transposase
MKNRSWFLFRDNVPAHWSILVKNFLANNNVTKLEFPSYSPNLAAAEFYLFPQLISALKGRSLSDYTDNIKNVAES